MKKVIILLMVTTLFLDFFVPMRGLANEHDIVDDDSNIYVSDDENITGNIEENYSIEEETFTGQSEQADSSNINKKAHQLPDNNDLIEDTLSEQNEDADTLDHQSELDDYVHTTNVDLVQPSSPLSDIKVVKKAEHTTSKTSRLGHLRNNKASIFEDLNNMDRKIDASSYQNQVFYIKLESEFKGERYYLISEQASSERGVIGWVRETEMRTHPHVGVDTLPKTLIINGHGQAFKHAWGGSKDLVYDLSDYEGLKFSVNKTERVGNNTWYRGILEGEEVFIHEAYVDTIKESSTSRLGHLRDSATIYPEIGDVDSATEVTLDQLEYVYYIKKQADIGSTRYYLIGKQPNTRNEVIGWVKATDIQTHLHTGIDTIPKTLIANGRGQAFTKAWGGSGDLVYNLSDYTGAVLKVNKTERVGNNTWYRGILEGKEVFIHEAYVMNEIKSGTSTSRLGHIKTSEAVIIGRNGGRLSSNTTKKYLNQALYIKSETSISGNKYYLISTKASASQGVIGWIHQKDISTHEHKGIDTRRKVLYTNGNGNAYTKAWGGEDDHVYDLSKHKNKPLVVNKTERVGRNTWYRGHLDGKQVFIHSAYLESRDRTSTSLLGHLDHANVRIYETFIERQRSNVVGTAMLNKVFYIKQQANFDGQLFYLISEEPSATKGIYGWINAKDMRTHPHSGLDTRSKTFYINGNGNAFTKAWGGNQDLVYKLSDLKGRQFNVHKTERVGKNTWYRGDLDGKRVFIHSAYLSEPNDQTISRLGHLSSSSIIYDEINNLTKSKKVTSNQLNKVYYIKKQRIVNGDTFYLISEQPSSTRGTIGWVKSTDMRTHPHVGVDTNNKVYSIIGTGNAYTKAWGGSQDLVYSLSGFEGSEFRVNKTERVGNNIWYRGHLDGKEVFIHESYVNTSNVWYQPFEKTLNEALATQMNQLQQTDKYRNHKAYILKSHVNLTGEDTITGNGVRLRSAANFNNNIVTTVNSGTKIEIIKEVTGATYAGSTTWYQIKYNNTTLYVHSSLAKKGSAGRTNQATNVRMTMSNSGHVFGRLSANTSVNIINEHGNWLEIGYQTWRNPTRADVLNYLNPDNHDMYQHLLLTESVGVSARSVNNLLKDKGILQGRGQAFIDASRTHSVNEVYLISHALLETGHGGSDLAQGIEVGVNSRKELVLVTSSNRKNLSKIKKVYNMFGIGAVDGDAKRGGAIRAYEEGWDTPDKAIIGGARFIGQRYVHNSYNQNTLYKMRWNPANPGYPQYATDIAWAVKQVSTIKSMYSQLDSPALRFLVPRYK